MGAYPLTYACFSVSHKAVRLIIEHGGDVNSQGGPWGSALRASCFLGFEETIQTLLESGANVNVELYVEEKSC